MYHIFLAHRQLLKSTFVKDLNRSIAGTILGEGAERSCQFLKDKKQLIEVVETEGLGLICFSLIGVNVRQSDWMKVIMEIEPKFLKQHNKERDCSIYI